LDDKISRLQSAQNDEDEDVITDLIGYLVLLKIVISREKENLDTTKQMYGDLCLEAM